MDELIQQVVGKFGIDESSAQQAVGMVMSLLKQEGKGDLFGKIAAAVPGAEQAADQAPNPEESSGLMGKMAGMLGGNTGKGAALTMALKKTGLQTDQLSGFGELVINFLRDKAGSDVVDQIVEQVPMVKGLLK